jgi:hypothetical protein
MSLKHLALVVFASGLAIASVGCDKKPESTSSAGSEAKKADEKKAEKKEEKAEKKEEKAEKKEEKAEKKDDGPSAGDDKEFLGLDLKAMGSWKPKWDADAKVAKWEDEDFEYSIVNRVVKEKLESIDDLKSEAGMMMQLGSAITKVSEEKKTDKGWYAVVEREAGTSDLIYVRKFGGAQVVCSANLKKADLGKTIAKADALKACESLALKK